MIIFCIGFTLVGINNLLISTVAIDLADDVFCKNNPNAISSISSLVEGISGLIAAGIFLLIPYVKEEYIFYIFTGFCFVTGISIVSRGINEVIYIDNKNKNKLL